MLRCLKFFVLAMVLVGSLVWAAPARAVDVKVTVENLGATGSLFLTPVWLGLHDGTFDLYDSGVAASGFGGLESLAEDGDTSGVGARFDSEQGATGGVDDTLLGLATGPPPLDPGESASLVLSVADPTVNRYFSYASMVIPSNDAFIANGNPLAHAIFDMSGNFIGTEFLVLGADVLDAGTEQNTETDVAFLSGVNGQAGPNSGADEGGLVGSHVGFNGSVGNPGGSPMNILGGTTASGALVDSVLADFTRNGGGEALARISFTVIPEPTSFVLAIIMTGVVATATGRRRTDR